MYDEDLAQLRNDEKLSLLRMPVQRHGILCVHKCIHVWSKAAYKIWIAINITYRRMVVNNVNFLCHRKYALASFRFGPTVALRWVGWHFSAWFKCPLQKLAENVAFSFHVLSAPIIVQGNLSAHLPGRFMTCLCSNRGENLKLSSAIQLGFCVDESDGSGHVQLGPS